MYLLRERDSVDIDGYVRHGGGVRAAAGLSMPTEGAASALLRLIEAVRSWSAGDDIDEAAIARLRETVIVTNHTRFVESVPAYRSLAADAGLTGSVRLRDISEQLVVGDGFLKSYDPAWLDTDLPALTDWLDSVCTHPLRGLPIRSTHATQWRAELKTKGIAVTFSSGTAGHPALVPRDRATLAALRVAGGVRLPWTALPDPHDALLLVGEGLGSGLQSGAAGLASSAERAHYLTAGSRGGAGEALGATAEDYDRALAFATAAAREHHPLLVFGAPAALVALLDSIEGSTAAPRLPPGSVVATGGGWKRGSAQRLPDVVQRVTELLGVPATRCVDTYSTAELNTVLVSCSAGRYHVPPALAVMVLDELMRPQPVPAAGHLAFLDPFALSYPGFIATGDHARLRDDPCPCGLVGATLDGPITRLAAAHERGCGTTAGDR